MDPDAVSGVSGVGCRGIGVLDGCRMGRGSFGGKCGASRCNQWGLCGMVILCLRDGDAALPKLLSDFLFTSLLIYFCENRPRLQDIMCRIGVGFIDRSVVI